MWYKRCKHSGRTYFAEAQASIHICCYMKAVHYICSKTGNVRETDNKCCLHEVSWVIRHVLQSFQSHHNLNITLERLKISSEKFISPLKDCRAPFKLVFGQILHMGPKRFSISLYVPGQVFESCNGTGSLLLFCCCCCCFV